MYPDFDLCLRSKVFHFPKDSSKSRRLHHGNIFIVIIIIDVVIIIIIIIIIVNIIVLLLLLSYITLYTIQTVKLWHYIHNP